MFHFEEGAGVLTLLPNMALVKLPCMAFKVYMFCFLQRSGLLLVSLLWDVILNGVKTYKIVSHVRTARKYKSWLADPERSDVTLSAKTVREKLLKKHFFFQESQTTGKLQDPGLWLGCGHVIAAFLPMYIFVAFVRPFFVVEHTARTVPLQKKQWIYVDISNMICLSTPNPCDFQTVFQANLGNFTKFEVGLVLANLWWPMLCPRTTQSHRLFGSLDNS